MVVPFVVALVVAPVVAPVVEEDPDGVQFVVVHVVEDVLDGDHVVVEVALLVVEAVGMVELEAVTGIAAGGEVEHVV